VTARFTLDEAAFCAGAEILAGTPSLGLEGVFTDSRKPQKGALFVALVGEKHDASEFAAQAAKDGAAAVLVPRGAAQRVREEMQAAKSSAALLAATDTGRALGALAHAWRERFADLCVVAVTGSTGKTSTKELIASVLETAGSTMKTEGNLNNEIGVPLTLLRLSSEHRYAVIECGMNHLGEIARLVAWADPEVGVVTNVGPVHLEGCGSIDGVAHAKGEMFHGLRESATAVANADDARVLAQARLSRRRLMTFGAQRSSHVRLVSAHHGGAGLRVELAFPDGKVRLVELHLIGTHNGGNAAAAAAVGYALGLDPDLIVRGLGNARTPGRRMRPVPLENGAVLIDDCYNANPQSTKAALLTLTHLVRGKGRAIAVLGDMLELGPTELDLHRDVGRFAAGAGLGLLVAFGQRARAIGEGAIESGMKTETVRFTSTPEEAIELLRANIRPEDVILVKGSRGMRMERISDSLSPQASSPSESH